MAVKESRVFRASDGLEFDSKDKAETHDRLVTAEREFEEARHRYAAALACTQKTADGKEFKFEARDFYWIRYWPEHCPVIRTVRFWYHARIAIDEQDRLTITQEDEGKSHSYRIEDLYWSRRSAEEVVLKLQEEWLQRQTEAIQEARKNMSR